MLFLMLYFGMDETGHRKRCWCLATGWKINEVLCIKCFVVRRLRLLVKICYLIKIFASMAHGGYTTIVHSGKSYIKQVRIYYFFFEMNT